jgi:hypothetical protein
MRRMDQQGRGAVSDASIDMGSARRPLGVSVFGVDGERLGTVSDCQDMRHFLIVHNGRQVGHDTYIPHAAIRYSDMNGVHLRLRQGDLTSMKQQPLSEQSAPIFTALPVLVPDMGVAAVAATAFTDHATSTAAPASSPLAQFAVEVAQEDTGQVGREACQGIWQGIGQGVGQTTGLVHEQVGALHERVKSRRPWWRSSR